MSTDCFGASSYLALQMIATLFIRDENINIDLFMIEHFKVPPSSAVLKIPA